MEQLAHSPFAVLTFIVAPALLTNASSVLALSTINRMLRTRDRMHELFSSSEAGERSESEGARLVGQVNRVEKQAMLLLGALRSIYVALGAFAAATLVTLLGAGVAPFPGAIWFNALAGLGLLLGFLGVGGLVLGCVKLFQATQLSLINIREEAAMIRTRQASRKQPLHH
jgi:type IV secretory pathway TrbD component